MSDDKKIPPSDVHPTDEAEVEAAAGDSSPAGAGPPVASGSPPAASTPPSDPAVDRILVDVQTAMKPVVVWQCPGCKARLEGQDPAMIKHLVAGNLLDVACKACGQSMAIQVPRIQKVKPNIIMPGGNRKQRRGLVKLNGGKR